MRQVFFLQALLVLTIGAATAHLRQPLPPSVPPVNAASRPVVPPSHLPPPPIISPAPLRPPVPPVPPATNTTRLRSAQIRAEFDATVDLKEEVYSKLRGMVKEVCNKAFGNCASSSYSLFAVCAMCVQVVNDNLAQIVDQMTNALRSPETQNAAVSTVTTATTKLVCGGKTFGGKWTPSDGLSLGVGT